MTDDGTTNTSSTTDSPDLEQPPSGAPDTPPAAPPTPAFNRRELSIGGLCAAAGLIVGIVGSLLVTSVAGGLGSLGSTAMADAVETCDLTADPWIELGDEGQSLSMQTDGEESPGADVADVVCVLGEIETPDSVLSRISNTRALDGRQSATWDNYSASWGYHPDNGLDIVIELAQQ